MGEIRLRMACWKFLAIEFFSGLWRKRWVLIFLLMGVNIFLTEKNFVYLSDDHHTSLNYWQLAQAVLSGPSLHPPTYEILGWLFLPTLFILGIGEPFSLLQRQWMKMLLSRIPSRLNYWWCRLVAWFVLGFLFAAFVVLVSLLLSGLITSSHDWGIPPILILNGKGQPFSIVFLWLFVNFLMTIWWYTTILFTCSALFSRPGIATIVTLYTGYILTYLGTHYQSFSPYLRPLLGGEQNAFLYPILVKSSFLSVAISSFGWFLLNILGYVIFHRKDL